MARDIESDFRKWSASPSETENQRSENAIRAIKEAVRKSPKLGGRKTLVFVQGSYRNRVNVRQDSDVDVGVMLYDYFLRHYPDGMNDSDFGNFTVDYGFRQFKDDLEDALVAHFGREAVHRGNKAFDVRENSYRVEADVVPLFEYRHYWESKSYNCGVALVSDRGEMIRNYPEKLLNSWPNISQHYENGVAKNINTSRAFKAAVRILKKIRNEMDDAGRATAKPIPGFLIECMCWNVPDENFKGANWGACVHAVVGYIRNNTMEDSLCEKWTEVNNFKYLFHVSQPWSRAQAHAFVDDLWHYVSGLR